MAGHPPNAGYIPGDHWVVCFSCGLDYRSSEMKKRWDGIWVCPEDYETRQPQDFVRAGNDKIAAELPVNPEDTTNTTDVTFAADTSTIPSGTFDMSLD